MRRRAHIHRNDRYHTQESSGLNTYGSYYCPKQLINTKTTKWYCFSSSKARLIIEKCSKLQLAWKGLRFTEKTKKLEKQEPKSDFDAQRTYKWAISTFPTPNNLFQAQLKINLIEQNVPASH